jgi:XTP/dITP diphosphohydrolase
MKINKLLVATHNPGKFKEIKQQLTALGIKVVSLKDLGIEQDFEETGNTFEENARGKAQFYHGLSDMPTLADDSGLEVDALNGEPSVKSRRWPGYEASDQELYDMLIQKLDGVPMEQRTARFVATSVIIDGDEEVVARGENKGTVGLELACPIEPGLPWSSVFYPEGYDVVFSQLDVAEKNKISHRGKALDKVIKELKNND